MMMKCKHATTTTDATSVRCYAGPVAVAGHENRAAHGCITQVERCLDCGAERRVNVNGVHYEVGPWGPSRSQLAREAE